MPLLRRISERPIGYSFSFFQTIFLNRKCKLFIENIIFPRKIISSTETQIRVRKYYADRSFISLLADEISQPVRKTYSNP